MKELELVRGDERLACDRHVWRNTLELARAFGWKAKSTNLRPRALSKLTDESDGLEVACKDARLLAQAILQGIGTLAINQRLNRRQAASFLWFASNVDDDGSSVDVHLDKPAQLANFCHGGGFHLVLKV